MVFTFSPLTLLGFWNLCSCLLTTVISCLLKWRKTFSYITSFHLLHSTLLICWPLSLNTLTCDFQSFFLGLFCGLLTHSLSSRWLCSHEYCLLISFLLARFLWHRVPVPTASATSSILMILGYIFVYIINIYVYVCVCVYICIYMHTLIFSPKTLSCLTYFYDGLWYYTVSL